jgi:hypothetical protein
MYNTSTKVKMIPLFVEIPTEVIYGHIVSSTLRPATLKDIEEAKEKYKTGHCDHRIIVDEPRWMYDFRSCYICGKGLGCI